MKKNIFRSLFLIPVLLAAVSLSGCGEEKPTPYVVDLEVWGVFDDTDAYQEALSGFQSLNSGHIGQITYRKLPIETYKEDLLRAFAEGRGPDIFMIRNSWIPSLSEMIAAAPAYQTNEKEYRDAFVDVAAKDFVVDGKIYGAPLSVDSLALYYNKDLFNAAGITSPPATWEELVEDSRLLNAVDPYGNISQSAVALGTGQNINRSMDILLALGLQSGTEIRAEGFSDSLVFSDVAMTGALDFYSQFARLGSDRYSWNPRQHYSLDAFYEGTLGMMVNYSWHMDTIRKKNAKLNFAVAPLPQFSGKAPSDYANYWGFAVAKNKVAPSTNAGEPASVPEGKYNDLRVHESWQFLHYLAFPHQTKTVTLRNPLGSGFSAEVALPDDPARAYLEKTGKPAARRDLVELQKNDQWLSAFAYGNLVSTSLRSQDIEKVERILGDAIDSVARGENTPSGALQTVHAQVQIVEKNRNQL